MLLVIEVGNTNTKIGVFSGPRLLASWRLTTRREQTADEYGVFIQTLLSTRGIGPQGITGVAVDLDADGALVLRTDGGETLRIVAGEVAMEAIHAARH